jgi:hypothetical protein
MAHLVLVHRSGRAAMIGEHHVSVEDIASLIDGSLPPDERDAAERHLAHCDDCREELAASSRAVASATTPTTRRLPWRLILPLAAGIVLAVFLRPTPPAEHQPAVDTPERAAPARETGVVTVFPPPRSTLRSDALRFVWRSVVSSTGYHVVVKDPSGVPLWEGDVADTVLTLPESVRLRPGESYVWRVDAQRADFTTVSSAETPFRIDR